MSFLRHFVVTGPIFEAKQNFFLNNSAEIKNQDFFNLMKTDKKTPICYPGNRRAKLTRVGLVQT